MLDCPDLSVPHDIMRHVVHVESANNPFAIGVVGGRLSRQPRNLLEALEAVRLLKEQGYNFSVGIAQVNRYNLARYGLKSYAEAFEVCPNLRLFLNRCAPSSWVLTKWEPRGVPIRPGSKLPVKKLGSEISRIRCEQTTFLAAKTKGADIGENSYVSAA